ncbi:uncharacterized protein PG986_012142 [Apiospora aurea]|uniref:Uncharacterized protein n=1 Tax=Apiospora aurea TaxID=335848 RepID=A0ABR1PZK4_9PEZI
MSDLTPGSMANFSCTIGHWAGAAVPHDITALAACCENAQNITKQPDDCVLWCELPRDRFPPNPKYDPPSEGKYIDRFNECIKANLPEDGNGLATGVQYPNNANKTDGSKSSASSSSPSGPSPTAGGS